MPKIIIGIDAGTYSFNVQTKQITISNVPGLTLQSFQMIVNQTTGKTLYVFNGLPASFNNNIFTLNSNTDLTGCQNSDALSIYVMVPELISNQTSDIDLNAPSVVVVNNAGPIVDDTTIIELQDSGESSYVINDAKTILSIGSNAKQPGRIYTEGRGFYNNQQPIYLNGCNTAWIYFNEIGAVNTSQYDPIKWTQELDRLVDRGINAVRVWIVCSCENEGVTLTPEGICNDPTELFWQNLDNLVNLMTERQLYLKVSVFSFDNFIWTNPNQDRWVRMIGSETGVQSLIDKYLVPLALRYKDNPYFFCIDLGNELDWITIREDLCTPKDGTCTPVGNGSNVVNFSAPLPDYVVGMQLLVDFNNNLGAITSRVSDTQCTTTLPYMGTSQTFSVPNWGFSGFTWKTLQRYLAMASAAIHNSGSNVLVTMGQGVIKNGSDLYDGDKYTDIILSSLTGDGASKLDFHSIHWYSWAQPWYRFFLSPVQNGLSEKPAMMGEMPIHFSDMNMPNMTLWKPNTYYTNELFPRTGLYIRVKDQTTGFPQIYKLTQIGTSSLDAAPSGSGTITDGTCIWQSVDKCYTGLSPYNIYDIVLSDTENTSGIGRLYMCTQSGTTGNDGGPYGTGEITLGTTIWKYINDAVVDERTAYNYFYNNGWVGHMPWMSNFPNNAFYETDFQGNYPIQWMPLFDNYVNEEVVNNNKFYRCITSGKTASSIGPTGTNSDIIDGTVHWKYVKTLTNPPWTSSGIAIKEFSDTNHTALFPDISGAWNNKGYCSIQSKGRTWYYGTGLIRTIQTFKLPNVLTYNELVKIGPFDTTDGITLNISGNNINNDMWYTVINKENEIYKVYRNNWNIDKLDGTGPSNKLLDFNDIQSFVVDFNYKRNTKLGFIISNTIIWTHIIDFNNTVTYPSNPNLPLKWELSSSGAIPNVKTLEVYSGYSQYNEKKKSKIRSWSPGSSIYVPSGGGWVEAWALHIASDLQNWKKIIPTKLNITSASTGGTYRINWRLTLNPIASNSFVWNKAVGSDCVEYTTSRGLSSFGTVIASGWGLNTIESILNDLPSLEGEDILSFQVSNIENSANYFLNTITWDEG